MLRCSLCEQLFENVPAGAIQLGKGRGNKCLYRLPDGTLHDLYPAGAGRKKQPKVPVPKQPTTRGIRTVAVYASEDKR